MEVNDSNFEKEVLKSDLPVLVDFWAPWCGPCQMVAPFVEELAREYEGKIKVGKVNVDEAPNVAARYQIMSIPTLAIFKDGELKDTLVGVAPKEAIEEKIKPYI